MDATGEAMGAPTLVALGSNQPADRFYRGGPRISAFRGERSQGPRTPEDWVGSTTTVRGRQALGLTELPDHSLLVDAVERQPLDWLGPEHVQAFGKDTKLLVKLLDSGQRLPVHAHPDAGFALDHLGARHGKAEAWYILTAGEVFLGLREEVSLPRLQSLVDEQDIEALLQLMHRVPVEPHQTVYVPPGVLHAIGEGVFLVEVQEPEDLSILLEWRDFELDGRADGHLGLGFDTALSAVETHARTGVEVAGLLGGGPRNGALTNGGVTDGALTVGDVLAAGAAEYFRLERVTVDGEAHLDRGFAVLIITAGSLAVTAQDGTTVDAARGATLLIPFIAGDLRVCGRGQVLMARPPRPGPAR
jgi:mannose-6-phosphate isomerase